MLIVDGNVAGRKLGERVVRQVAPSWEIDSASSGAEALRKQGLAPFDLVTIDLALPDLPGIELAQALLDAGSRSEGLLLVAYGDDAQKAADRAGLPVPCYPKPLAAESLAEAVSAVERLADEGSDLDPSLRYVRTTLARVAKQVRCNTLQGPVLSRELAELKLLAKRADVTTASISEFLCKHQILGARAICLANSSLYGGKSAMKSIDLAVSRLGLDGATEFFTGVANAGPAPLDDPMLRKVTVSQLRRAQLVGLLSEGVARYFGGEPGEALTLGLFHNVGATMLVYACSLAMHLSRMTTLTERDLWALLEKETVDFNLTVRRELTLPLELDALYLDDDASIANATPVVRSVRVAMWAANRVYNFRSDIPLVALDDEVEVPPGSQRTYIERDEAGLRLGLDKSLTERINRELPRTLSAVKRFRV